MIFAAAAGPWNCLWLVTAGISRRGSREFEQRPMSFRERHRRSRDGKNINKTPLSREKVLISGYGNGRLRR